MCFGIKFSLRTCLFITLIDWRRKNTRFEALLSAQKVGEKSETSPHVEALLIYRLQRDANICDRGSKKRSSGFCPIKIKRHEHTLHRQPLKRPCH